MSELSRPRRPRTRVAGDLIRLGPQGLPGQYPEVARGLMRPERELRDPVLKTVIGNHERSTVPGQELDLGVALLECSTRVAEYDRALGVAP